VLHYACVALISTNAKIFRLTVTAIGLPQSIYVHYWLFAHTPVGLASSSAKAKHGS